MLLFDCLVLSVCLAGGLFISWVQATAGLPADKY